MQGRNRRFSTETLNFQRKLSIIKINCQFLREIVEKSLTKLQNKTTGCQACKTEIQKK